ncbi:GNAT family N-acetyltransferase [Ekhidna sp.]
MINLENVVIQRVKLDELSQLREIGKRTFLESFGDQNKKEDMDAYLEKSFAENQLMSELSDDSSEFYFAKLDGQIIGYLKVNYENSQTEIKDSDSLEIERIYVIKEFHGQKVGQLLYKKALDIAVSKNMKFLWLGVWEKNPRAIRFYEKNGFVTFDKHTFLLGSDMQTDLMMKLNLA